MKTIAVLIILFLGFSNAQAQGEMEKYGEDVLFEPLFEFMRAGQLDSAIQYLDNITLEEHGLNYYKAALLYKLDIKFDIGGWDISMAREIESLLPHWTGDSLSMLNMYGIVCKENGELKKAREAFEFCYNRRPENIYLFNLMEVNILEGNPKKNLDYESKIDHDSMKGGHRIMAKTYLALKDNKKAYDHNLQHLEASEGFYIDPETYIDLIEIIQAEGYEDDPCTYLQELNEYFEIFSKYSLAKDKAFVARLKSRTDLIDLDCE